MTIVVHHLDNSRSQRILWLLEELGLAYEIKHYKRRFMLAPPEMAAIHPLGKSPILTDGPITIAESGAIVEYLVEKAGGRLGRPADPENARRYTYYMHYAEGSLMALLVMILVVDKLPPLGWVAARMFRKRLHQHLAVLENDLSARRWFAGDGLTAADVMMSFALEFANALASLKNYPNLTEWLGRIHSRAAYVAGLERGGPTIYR